MSHALDYLIRPTFLLWMMVIFAIVNLWRKRKEDRRKLLWLTIPFVLLTVISLPVVAYLAQGTLEWSYIPLENVPKGSQVLVVLSGSMYAPDTGRRDQVELGANTYYRCLHALRLYRNTPGMRILVSGGIAEGAPQGPPLAEAMRDFFLDHGVNDTDLMVENRAQTTQENALECGKILRERGLEKMVLITDANHMWRSLMCFQKQGLEVYPSACNSATARFRNQWHDYLPSPYGAAGILNAFHEWMGVGYYKIRGWI
jgi:uncharacterized SAM-binding protein YcdF (DUF218 family)